MMSPFGLNLCVAIVGIVAVMALGGALPFWVPRIKRHLSLALALAAGIMLGVAVIHLYPESYGILGARSGYALLAGFVFLYCFERFVTVHICETLGCEVHTIGLSALFGLSLHTFANGVALGAGVAEGIGGVVFLAIAAHKVPETFSLTAILLHEQYRPQRIVGMNLLLMSMIPLGTVSALAMVRIPSSTLAGWALGFSAGTFLHVAISDLLPEVHRASPHKGAVLAAFLGGLIIAAASGMP